MKNLLNLTIFVAAIAAIIASCETEKYEFNLPSPEGGDTTIVNNYYYIDTSGTINYDIREYNINLEGDCNVVGIFINNDSDSSFTDYIDDELAQIVVCPEEYPNPPIITFNQYLDEEGCTVWEIFVDDSLHSSKKICPDTIEIFLPDTTFIHDTTIVIDTVVIRDTVFIEGKDYVREYFHEEFNNPGNSSYYDAIGWDRGSGFYIYQVGGNGTIVNCGSCDLDTIWSPQIFSEPMKIDSINISVGSLNHYLVSILLKDVYGNIFVVDSFDAFSSNFCWQDITTYNQFVYILSVPDIVKIGLSKQGVFHPSTRDEALNSDVWSATGIKLLN